MVKESPPHAALASSFTNILLLFEATVVEILSLPQRKSMPGPPLSLSPAFLPFFPFRLWRNDEGIHCQGKDYVPISNHCLVCSTPSACSSNHFAVQTHLAERSRGFFWVTFSSFQGQHQIGNSLMVWSRVFLGLQRNWYHDFLKQLPPCFIWNQNFNSECTYCSKTQHTAQ